MLYTRVPALNRYRVITKKVLQTEKGPLDKPFSKIKFSERLHTYTELLHFGLAIGALLTESKLFLEKITLQKSIAMKNKVLQPLAF